MKATIEGTVVLVKPLEVISDKFRKRTVRIAEEGKYPSTLDVEAVNDNAHLADGLAPGMQIRAELNIKGKVYEKTNKAYPNLYIQSVQTLSNANAAPPAPAQAQQEPSGQAYTAQAENPFG